MPIEMQPAEVVPAFDELLAACGLQFTGVIIGGSALVLLGVVQRTTEDCDILDPDIPSAVREAAEAFAEQRGIDRDWFKLQGPRLRDHRRLRSDGVA
ncbi:MAG: hypothetical protein IPG17_04220 [Sandaracinaceae bacterium]|nr:hypothetical protein [Sandaracinaceae bacterium]MBP7683152.1 hypothetical protein [Deltaproteobacteria bacterium]MBK6807373.1 hypothetical protein [Sandaracinaceae bacterium]MBK7152172.1 hypothetical protein [Sandaracinaceae bacterium]MBK7778796.1 hypothetical protein [Sandaracinaceae bacterium]